MFTLLLLAALCAAPTNAEKQPPNLVPNGDFEKNKGQTTGFRPVPEGWEPTDGVKVNWAQGYGKGDSFGIRIQMDRPTAEGYGQGYFSAPIPIEEGEVYTISVDVKSDAPNAMVFVKGFTTAKGKDREAFSHHKEAHFDRYLKLNEWTNITFAFRPRHTKYPIDHIKVWLYGYLKPGTLWFDNVRITKGGTLTPNPIPQPPPRGPKKPVLVPPDSEGDSHPPVYLDPNSAGKG